MEARVGALYATSKTDCKKQRWGETFEKNVLSHQSEELSAARHCQQRTGVYALRAKNENTYKTRHAYCVVCNC